MKQSRHKKWRMPQFNYWLALIGFCLVLAVHPVVAADRPVVTPYASVPLSQPTQDVAQLLETGRQYYDAGRFAESAKAFQQAAKTYGIQTDRLNQALSLSYLSLAAQALGEWQQAEDSIATSLELINTLPPSDRDRSNVLAQALNTQGKLQLAQGKAEVALTTWQAAERAYTQINDMVGVIGSRINQAQALQSLGFYHRAQNLLTQINQQLNDQPPSALKVVGLRTLGEVLQVAGDLTNAQMVLEESLKLAQQLKLPGDISAALFSLGNAQRAAQDNQTALKSYQQAAAIAPSEITRLEAQVNQLSLLIDLEDMSGVGGLLRQLEPQLINLAPSRAGIYVQVNWAASALRSHRQWVDQNLPPMRAIAARLAFAIQQARLLQDTRAESFALGYLGYSYEQTQQWSEAKKLTQKAIQLAQEINAADIAYRWYWQLGRIHKQAGDRAAAIAAYSESVQLLKALRRDLVAMSATVQFAFRETIDPVYRELVELLVESSTPEQVNVQTARSVIEALQQAELENFLRSACLEPAIANIETADPAAAVIYPIILKEQLVVITSLPGQTLSFHTIPLAKAQLEAVLEQTLASLNPIYDDQERLRLSGEIYNWLIRPIEASLAKSQVKTLVFVLEGKLRNLPMAALYDGQRYLIESYSVAVTPGLQLLGPQAPLQKNNLRALVGALTDARQGFVALPGVAVETQGIATHLAVTKLLNQSFTQTQLQTQLQDSGLPIVHLATHGQFSSNLDKTFILTWDDRLTVDGIRKSLKLRSEKSQQPIELLVLSACETAEGDDRAALGLAGLAVRSGARSTLASLWSVNDASTADLMVKFYQALTRADTSKAEALRQSQLALLRSSEYQHPFYWAAFILIGNWL